MADPFVGFFTGPLDELKSFIEGVPAYSDWRVFFGPIAEGEFFSVDKPAVSIQLNGSSDDPKTGRGWHQDISVILIQYDPKYTDDYDVIDVAEVLMNNIHSELGEQGQEGKNLYGDITGVNTFRIDHDDSYVFAFEIKLTLWRIEVED